MIYDSGGWNDENRYGSYQFVCATSASGPHVLKSALTVGGLALEAAESHAGVLVSAIASMASVAQSQVSVEIEVTTMPKCAATFCSNEDGSGTCCTLPAGRYGLSLIHISEPTRPY